MHVKWNRMKIKWTWGEMGYNIMEMDGTNPKGLKNLTSRCLNERVNVAAWLWKKQFCTEMTIANWLWWSLISKYWLQNAIKKKHNAYFRSILQNLCVDMTKMNTTDTQFQILFDSGTDEQIMGGLHCMTSQNKWNTELSCSHIIRTPQKRWGSTHEQVLRSYQLLQKR